MRIISIVVRLEKKICWLSAGVSSFIAGWLERETIDEFIYIDVADQHPDSMRFIKDCEKALGKEVKILKSEYECVENCVLMFNGFKHAMTGFAPCTNWLKKRVRKDWEDEHFQTSIPINRKRHNKTRGTRNPKTIRHPKT